jgi:hypothetical protein
MKNRIIIVVACVAIAAACATLAEPPDRAQWVGVWQGKLDELPSVTLTLADDTGELDGTLVLNVIEKQDGQARIAAIEPHVLVHPHFDGNVFSFGVRKIDGSRDLLNFTAGLTPEGKARIHCTNCGAEAPVVDMDRLR